MARTRTSDPGRVTALHYAAAAGQRHAKRLVYAYFLLLWPAAPAWSVDLPAAAQSPQPPTTERSATAVPCVACQSFSLQPAAIDALPEQLAGTRVLVRISPGALRGEWGEALASILRRGGTAGLHVMGVPGDADPSLSAGSAMLLIEVADGDPDRTAFDLKRALAAARGASPSTTLAIAASPAMTTLLRERGLGPYADAFVAPAAAAVAPGDLLTPVASDELRVWRLPEPVADARAMLSLAARLREWLPAGLVPVSGRTLTCGEDRPLRALLNPQTLDLIAVSGDCPASAVVTSDIPGVTAERADVGGVSVFRVPAGATDRFAEGVNVAAARSLSIDEVIARHQAAAARLQAQLRTSIATGSLTLTFEAPGFVAPITITSQTTIFTQTPPTDAAQPAGAARVELLQQQIRVNGAPFAARGGVPRLPIVEPERAAAPPLAITLSDVYRYRLDGRERLNGRDCYIVAFAPRQRDAALYEGRAWIDTASFAMVRASAAQTGLKGPITASEQIDDFIMEDAGHWRLARSNVRQTYEGASVRSPIHRLLIIERYEVNPSDFAARLAAAYGSGDVMLRDTPEGFRYLKLRGTGQKADAKAEGAGQKADAAVVTRVLAGRADRIRTLAFGVIVDPNISVPLPFAGLSYVDFNLFGTGAQFSGFFGGSYGQLAFSAPSIRGTRWQLAGRAFGIATSYNDRAFAGGREQYAQDIRQRPAQAAVWLLRPLTPRSALRLEYDWVYTKFGAADETDPAFVVPRNQSAHALRAGVDVQRSGWQASVWASQARRVGWRAWGLPGAPEYQPRHHTYQRFGASLLRSRALSPRVTTRIEAAVMGGRNLDRFSRFSFGTFDNRLHGYPSALVRYDRGAVLRTAVAWSAAKVLRLDAFADTAQVRDPGFGPRLRNYTGLGAAVEAPAPFGTLFALEWGFGVQGVNTNGTRGTQVLRISGYKVF